MSTVPSISRALTLPATLLEWSTAAMSNEKHKTRLSNFLDTFQDLHAQGL